MAKFYNIEWVSPPSETPDNHGNYWYSIKIDGKTIKQLAKNPPTTGQRYGEITKETSRSGKEYYRFRPQRVPDGVSPGQMGMNPSSDGNGLRLAQNSSEILDMLRDIQSRLKRLMGEDEATEAKEDKIREVGNETKQAMEEEGGISLDDIPF